MEKVRGSNPLRSTKNSLMGIFLIFNIQYSIFTFLI